MRTIKKHNRIKMFVVFAIVLVFAASAGFTLGYFSDHAKATGSVTLKLNGQTVIDEHVDPETGEKDIQITNTGDNEMVLRVMIYGPDEMVVTANSTYWDKRSDGYYYYKKVLAPGESTPEGTLVASIKKINEDDADLGDSFDIIVKHQSALAAYDSNGKLIDPWSQEGGQ